MKPLKSKSNLYIGLMSGTSMDCIDAALVEIKREKIKLIATYSHPIDLEIRKEILGLCEPGDNAILRMGYLSVKLGRLFAHSVNELLKQSGHQARDIAAVGSHGQNVRHMPESEFPFTLQIGDPNIIASETGITTIADFRRRDIALGGQGAPLAPAFHEFLFKNFSGNQWILNIGGIANVTYIRKDQETIGFDTGPGNTLLDAWCYQHSGQRFDKDGDWAKSGTVNHALLQLLLSDPFFKRSPPKSTGLEYFNLNWLKRYLREFAEHVPSDDIQATLVELTATSIHNVLEQETAEHIWVCGGGTKNRYLMERLQTKCSTKILSTDVVGIPVDWIEAAAFAWLAHQTQHHLPGNLPSVTGAREAAVLGAVYYTTN